VAGAPRAARNAGRALGWPPRPAAAARRGGVGSLKRRGGAGAGSTGDSLEPLVRRVSALEHAIDKAWEPRARRPPAPRTAHRAPRPARAERAAAARRAERRAGRAGRCGRRSRLHSQWRPRLECGMQCSATRVGSPLSRCQSQRNKEQRRPAARRARSAASARGGGARSVGDLQLLRRVRQPGAAPADLSRRPHLAAPPQRAPPAPRRVQLVRKEGRDVSS
jgi:hypothetical protein